MAARSIEFDDAVRPVKPTALVPVFEGVPADLRDRHQWMVWRYLYQPEKNKQKPWTKPPFSVLTGRIADCTDPANWVSFKEACAAYVRGGFDGIGFAFSENDEFCGIDLDHSRDPQTEAIVSEEAAEILDSLNSYKELSASGTGAHSIVKAKLPGNKGRKRGNVEAYCIGRYFTCTGQPLADSTEDVRDCQAAVDQLYAKHFATPDPENPSANLQQGITTNGHVTDEMIVAKLCNCGSGKSLRLWDGSTEGYPSRSEAHLALIGSIAFWTGPDRERINRIFEQSKLRDERWDRDEYRERTIDKALEKRVDFYRWPAPEQTEARKFGWLDAAGLDSAEFNQRYIIPGVLAEGQHGIVCGSFKTLKSSIGMDLLLSVATGSPFLGHFPVPEQMPTAFMSGESGMKNLQNIGRRICYSRGWSLGSVPNFYITPVLPRFDNAAEMAELRAFVIEKGIKVLAIDPAYLCMDIGEDAHNLFLVGKFLKAIGELGQATGCCILILHHNKRGIPNYSAPAELSDIAWSGFAEFAAQWLLLSRRSAFDAETGLHELWLNLGGRDGHCGVYGIDVEEGRQDADGGRTWNVSVKPASETRASVSDDREQQREIQKEQKKLDKVVKARNKLLKKLPSFPDGVSARNITAASGVNYADGMPALLLLEEQGLVERCQFKQSRQTIDGWKLVKRWQDLLASVDGATDATGCDKVENRNLPKGVRQNPPIGGCRSRNHPQTTFVVVGEQSHLNQADAHPHSDDPAATDDRDDPDAAFWGGGAN
jgi:AAA domain